MLSLDNAYDESELREWDRRLHELAGDEKIAYMCELKLDGLSLALTYQNAQLVRGVTRGDGVIGEDVTYQRPHHSFRAPQHFTRQAARFRPAGGF